MKIDRGTMKTVVALLVMLVVFAGLVLLPTSIRNARNQQRINQAREKLGLGEVDIAGLNSLRQQVEDRRKLVDDTGRQIPDELELARVLRDLSELINAPGVSNQEIFTDKSKIFADYNIMPVRIQFGAPFATAFDLLQRIESLKYVVRIDKLDVESEPDYPSQPLLVNLELSAFFASAQQGDRP
jgi:Tfp pilus assembly protein PilO